MFNKLLIRQDIPHLFLSDVNRLVAGIKNDFPDIVKVDEIGYSWEQRPISMLTIDVDGSSMPIAAGKKGEEQVKPKEEKTAGEAEATPQASSAT